MKYGAWAKIPITVSQASVKKGKKASERKRDLNKLKRLFPSVLGSVIEQTYNENLENVEDSILNLSLLQAPPPSTTQNIDLLKEMFESVDNAYIEQVYGECNENISQATAFILEASVEDEGPSTENEFGSTEIGYVNREALNRRLNRSFGEMIVDMFPNVEREEALQVYEACERNMIKTFEILGCTNNVQGIEEEKNERPVKKYDDEYPANIGTPQTKVVRKGYWAKDQNNYFLDGNNVDAVKKISILKASFPAIDDVTVKEIFFQMGDNLKDSIIKLKELFPKNYREVEKEAPIFIPYPVQAVSKVDEPEGFLEEGFEKKMPDAVYNENIAVMQRSRQLHNTFFQAASNAASSGNFIEAKRLTDEGKKHQKVFKDVYLGTYKETFRRNNEKFGCDAIDLHGLQAEEALSLLDGFLKRAKGQVKKVEVVTGKGLHSYRCISRLKPAVAQFLSEKGYRFSELEGGYMVSLS